MMAANVPTFAPSQRMGLEELQTLGLPTRLTTTYRLHLLLGQKENKALVQTVIK
jgi:hypothetical protein